MGEKMSESNTRSFAKGVSWRFIASATTVSLAYIFTKDIQTTLEIGCFELVLKLLFYYLHERTWLKINWGKAHKDC